MKTAAVLCEYNPFHLGHQKQLCEMRKLVSDDGVLISIMSGSFVQRGGPALWNRRIRAAAAVKNGADLVIELPFPFSGAPADRFAFGGIAIAAGLSVDYLVFGSESGEEGRELFAEASRNEKTNPWTVPHSPLSFARARDASLKDACGIALPTGQNDRLAVEYFRAARRYGIEDRIRILKREPDGFSAYRARTALLEGRNDVVAALLPPDVLLATANQRLVQIQDAMPFLLSRLLTADVSWLTALYDIPKEIAARMIRAAKEIPSSSFEEFFERLKNKNDSNARLRRSLMTVLLAVKPEDLANAPRYGLILALSGRGRAYLRSRRKCEDTFPLLSCLSDAGRLGTVAKSQRDLSLRAESLYRLLSGCYQGHPSILSETPILLP